MIDFECPVCDAMYVTFESWASLIGKDPTMPAIALDARMNALAAISSQATSATPMTFRLAIAMAAIALVAMAAGVVAAQSPSGEVTFHWTQDGERMTETFVPEGLWMTGTTPTGEVFVLGGGLEARVRFIPDAGWTVGRRGDINHDGKVNIIDAVTVLQIIVFGD